MAGTWALILSCSLLKAADPVALQDRSLSVVNAGVSDAEDSPFVSRGYRFLPGDFVYLTFQISGFAFKANEEQDTRAISLAYNVALKDSRGRALAIPVMGEVKTVLNPQDKNWLPKRRASFLIPPHVPAGEYRVHIQVKDLLSGKEAEADAPVEIGGEAVTPTNEIAVQRFGFFREEDGRKPLDVPAFQPGDTVYARFTIAGFTTGNGNAYDVAYGVKVVGPDGKTFIEDPSVARLRDASFYPAQFLPGDIKITTKASSMRGVYTLILTVHDLLSGATSDSRQTFTLE